MSLLLATVSAQNMAQLTAKRVLNKFLPNAHKFSHMSAVRNRVMVAKPRRAVLRSWTICREGQNLVTPGPRRRCGAAVMSLGGTATTSLHAAARQPGRVGFPHCARAGKSGRDGTVGRTGPLPALPANLRWPLFPAMPAPGRPGDPRPERTRPAERLRRSGGTGRAVRAPAPGVDISIPSREALHDG